MDYLGYLEALAEARNVVNPANLREVEVALERKAKLNEWWKQETSKFLKEVLGVDLEERRKNWRSHEFSFDLDPFGFVEVSERKHSEHQSPVRGAWWKIDKVDIFNHISMRIAKELVATQVKLLRPEN